MSAPHPHDPRRGVRPLRRAAGSGGSHPDPPTAGRYPGSEPTWDKPAGSRASNRLPAASCDPRDRSRIDQRYDGPADRDAAFGSGPKGEPTRPQPGLPFDPPPAISSSAGGATPAPPGNGRRRLRRAAARPDRIQADILVPSKITVTRVAAARTRQLTTTAVRRINAASQADGAGETGLTGLIWTHALNVAGDALIAVSLAGTLFFAAAAGEQRSNVALYLLITMLPFAVVAPVIGPALDRLRRGRRWALAATLAGRALLAVVMAANYDNFALYPAALGALVLSKSFGVLKGAVVPRVLPTELTPVTANARMSIFGTITGGVAAGIGAGVAALLGFGWELGLTAAVFAAAAVLALRLPTHVDHADGELPADVLSTGRKGALAGRGRRSLGMRVVTALRGVAALRGLGGFLTIFTPFLVQGTIADSLDATLALGAIAGGAGLGSFLGTATGARVKLANPDLIVLIMVSVAAVACVVGAAAFSIPMMAGIALIAGFTNALGKHSLDAIIQLAVPETLRSSAFARSETLLQICWVLGGGIAIALPLYGWLAFTIAATLTGAAAILTVLAARRHRAATPGAAVS